MRKSWISIKVVCFFSSRKLPDFWRIFENLNPSEIFRNNWKVPKFRNKRKPQKLVDWLKKWTKSEQNFSIKTSKIERNRKSQKRNWNQIKSISEAWKLLGNVGAQNSMWNEIINSFSCFRKLPINRRSRILEFSENGRN